MTTSAKWPKILPELTPDQKRISEDFMKHWHEVLPNRYGMIERFNHLYSVRHAPPGFQRTLEIGAGLGEHLAYERLSPEQQRDYVALELRAHMAEQIRARFPAVQTLVGDIQERLPFADGWFDRVLAIHVLEHLPNLPAAVREIHRVCSPQGQLSVVIPCEGGLAYQLARNISARRVFEKRYRQPYDWFYKREHINVPAEIVAELASRFTIVQRRYFPLRLPVVSWNLCIGMTLAPRSDAHLLLA